MTHWNTDAVVAALQKAFPKYKVIKGEAGGDVDTENIQVKIGSPNSDSEGWDRFLSIAGFKTDGYYGDNRSDVEVDMVELTDHVGDGLQSGDPEEIRAYAEAMIILKGMGFQVVPYMKNYF